MEFTLYGKTVSIDDKLAGTYADHIHALTQDEIEYLGIACHFTEDTTAETMEKELAYAMADCLDIQAVTPSVIQEAKRRGLFCAENSMVSRISCAKPPKPTIMRM
jgi:hypothetical protein